MKKILFVLLSIILSFSMATASAASLEFSFDKESRQMKIGGTLGTSEHRPVMVYIYDTSIGSAGALNDSNPPVFAQIATTGANGKFDFSTTLSDQYPSSEYRITVASSEDSWSKDFMYANPGAISSLLPQINGASTDTALMGVIDSNLSSLGIDASVYNPVKTDAISFLYGVRPALGFANASNFINALDQCIAAARIKNGEDIASILTQYSITLSIDFEEDYNKFSSSVKSSVNSELLNASYQTELLSSQYPKLRTVAFMKAAPTAAALKNAFYGVDENGNQIVANYSVIITNPAADLAVFNSVQNKDSVFDQMFLNRQNLTSIENIRSEFASAALNVYTLEQGNGQSGGSMNGSGGGGVPSGPVAISPGYQSPSQPSKSQLFDDVSYSDWFYNSVERLFSLSLINGYDDKTYRPLNSITRAEYTKLIVGIADYLQIPLDKTASAVEFTDVLPDDWYALAVNNAAMSGLVTGADGKFNPNDLITRQDASVIIHRLVSKVKVPVGEKSFSDDKNIADYAKTAVSSLAASGIITGMGDNTFAPLDNLTRAQAAKLLCGVLDFIS